MRITPLFDEKAVKFDYRLVGEKDHVFLRQKSSSKVFRLLPLQ